MPRHRVIIQNTAPEHNNKQRTNANKNERWLWYMVIPGSDSTPYYPQNVNSVGQMERLGRLHVIGNYNGVLCDCVRLFTGRGHCVPGERVRAPFDDVNQNEHWYHNHGADAVEGEDRAVQWMEVVGFREKRDDAGDERNDLCQNDDCVVGVPDWAPLVVPDVRQVRGEERGIFLDVRHVHCH